MKKTKCILAFAMILSLLVSLGAPAFAAEPQYATTRAFLEQIAEVDGFECEVRRIIEGDTEKYEMVSVKYEGDMSDYKTNIQLLFSENLDNVQIYVYNLINFDAANYAAVLEAVNSINARTTGVKLFVDKSDNSVTAEMYQILCENDAADITLMATGFMIGFTDIVFKELEDYAVPAGPDFILPAALTTIESEAFAGGAFSYVKLSDKTTSIGSRAFADCPNLRYICIPETATAIAADTFSGVNGLTIFGESGSYAEFFAQRNGYAFIPLS